MAQKDSPNQQQQQQGQRETARHESLPPAVAAPDVTAIDGDGRNITISFHRSVVPDSQTDLWKAIRHHTDQIGFNQFDTFIKAAFCDGRKTAELDEFRRLGGAQFQFERAAATNCGQLPLAGFIPGVDLYTALKLAAEIFLLLRCGICPSPAGVVTGAEPQQRILVAPPECRPEGFPADVFRVGEGATSPDDVATLNKILGCFLGHDPGGYVNRIVQNLFGTQQFKTSPFCPVSVGLGPCLMELIWSYWHEQGMLVQTTNAIALRFQNVARRGGRDPLAEFELDPLRPLSGFLWGYIRDEPARLSVARRAYEYHHEYGLSLAGKAVARLRPADSRSKFLQGFHDLLRLTDQFYREASDNTVTPDPFPLLIALRDLHMILAEGMHNQFRDLPWTARSEMLVQQWILSRQETRDFLRGRFMTPYPEGWMGAVDAMKRLQGWPDTSVIHFSDLARFGERLLLSVRHVAWDSIVDPIAAQGWALEWRPEIQGYVHAYRMVTGVSLSDDVVEMNSPDSPRYLQPSMLLRTRQLEQRRTAALPEGTSPRLALPARARRALPRS